MEDFRERVVLDRLPEFDPKSRLFRAVEGITTPYVRSYTWHCDINLDQGYEGACVGFSITHELAARPKIILRDEQFARNLYYRAQELDEWEGEDYDGTSVLAGFKAVKEITNVYGQPLISEYRWAFGLKDVAQVLSYRGPLVLGVNWYEGMFDWNDKYFISPTGDVAGGHAILCNGIKIIRKAGLSSWPVNWLDVDLDRSYARLHNSWGLSYGLNGDVFITLRDLGYLLADQGEACIPTIRNVG